ncbi:CocE/NonD family hydrolase [Cesiribacter andamanensis]|uniref:Cocaine esterase n=1 Tax=Cesiribacter andamanensis AMV16 TaxID=1279009 RepID=M7N4Q1_9BACT|nr:CocE/NonD family hydrolase [Cesiribacter andamanensis]EMR02206.1 Cocaine esterase [Cesiribacter andamanensis AMV16]
MQHLRYSFALALCFLLTGALAQNKKLQLSDYEKQEVYIPMRDGTKLFTAIYSPKDKSRKYPFLMNRTPYSIAPYGADTMRASLGPSRYLMEEGYIFVYQDVRGRWMSEGRYDNMRPQLPNANKKKQKAIDESTDTWDTIDWLLKKVKPNNGKVGQWGISYPGYYAAAGALSNHPALVASSPQAPIADFFFDDFHHHGAYFLSYWLATTVFGYQKEAPTTQAWYKRVDTGTPDAYQFFMDMGSLKNASKWYGEDNEFWQQLVAHPNYDEFWQKRNLLPHLRGIDHAVLTVGGWFDAEDLYGPLQIYKTIEKHNPQADNRLVMGPWSHGDWSRNTGKQKIGYITFGDSISNYYQKNIEYPFFQKHLQGVAAADLAEAHVFDTGLKAWRQHSEWPPAQAQTIRFYFHDQQKLQQGAPPARVRADYAEFVSDPNKPVPFTDEIRTTFTPRKYMTEDQRHNSRRPDVLVFQTEVLEQDLTLSGELLARLLVSTDQQDADWVVKLIDVYPNDHPDDPENPAHIRLAGYQQLVRSETFRGRFRNSYEHPEPFTPNAVTEVKVPLQDVLHTFKKGHRIMVHVQSSWFPLIDRNPQKWVPNIFEANEEDFVKATHRLYHSQEHPSYLEAQILPK